MKSFLILSSFLLISFLGCNKSESPQNSTASAPQKPATVVDPNTAGSISGIISFKGAAPKMPMLDLSADPACPADPQPQDVVVVNNGKLANVFIYVKEGLEKYSFSPPSEPAILDQKKCRYVPHVLGLMVGQKLKVLNDDSAEHNVHPMARNNPQWNESQMPHGDPIVKSFQHPELMMPVECNQHPWMEMYLNVMEHPYFAVSAEDGSFQIKNLPPGEYTLSAVHEKFGEQTMKVTVAPKQAATANFAFAGKAK